MKKSLLILFAIVFAINLNSKAEDFSAVHNGKTIYYNITSSTFPQKVEVTFRGSNQTSYNEYSGSISIPDSVLYSGNYYKVTSIGNFAFYACNVLTSITIPNSVTSIGNNAFSICLGLISITIPNSLISIGSEAFKSCNGLTSITIPTSVTSIGIDAFYYTPYYDNMPNGVIYMGNVLYKYKGTMPANTSINIQSSTVSITERAFSGCVGLISITIPNSVTSIGNNTFNGCNGLTSITIPNSVTSIGYGAFNGCSGLTSITIPNSVTSISDYAFYLCSGLTSITFPNSVTSIGHFAFSGCSGGLTSIIIPNSVTSIGKSAFNNCSNLDTVYFNANNCTTMGNSTALVFTGCVNFKTLVIGDSVANIPSYAFNYCSALTSIHSKAITPPAQSNSFFGVSKIIPFYIPCNSISNYNSASYWSSFTNYIEVKNPQFINTSICDGSVYTNYGVNIDSAGVYTLVNGCDSVILNLIVNPIYNDTIIAEICSNEIYTLNGFNTNVAGFYTQNLQTIKGCDSIVNLSLLVNPIYLTNHYDTICQGQSYNNYGFNFIADTSGFYTQNLQTTKGCDSIINLSLIVNPIYNYTIQAEICSNEIYTLNGFNTNTAGFYTQNLQTIKGCDSIVNLSLLVNPIYNDTIIAEICSNEIYTLNGFNTNTAGFYTQNLQTIKGCDSIVNLSLIVNPIYNDTIFATICSGVTYSLYGFNETSIGFYTQSLQTTKGCDSIVNLSLDVVFPPTVELNMVTVDMNNNNVVVWDKDEVVNHYNIYRESNVANQFDLISTVSFDSASMFVDTNSNPTIKAYMYKVSTTDTCLNESELSPFHKTMHLIIGQGMGNNWNLSWTPYVGANYSTYNIYRGINTLDSLKFLTTISSNNTSYTDVNVPSGYVYYQVEIIIDTTQSKANENSIRSNYATNDPLGIVNYSQTNISTKLYPNPTEGKAKLEVEGLNSDAEVLVYDMIGRVIKKYKFNSEKGILEIDVSGYPKGVYSVSVQNNNINVSKKLIVQ